MQKEYPLPKVGTKAAKDFFFFSSWRDINRLFDFAIRLAGSAEFVARTAHETLMSIEGDEGKRVAMETDWKGRKSSIDELRANRQLLLEMILVRHVENFINYLSAVLYEIFTSRPETLMSSDKVEVSSILEHDSIESLVREIAESKVDSMSYSSFSKLSEFFKERFHIEIVDEADLETIQEFIEIRNISVHNRCYINKRFVSRLGLPPTAIGTKKEIYNNDVDLLIPKLAKIVKTLDVVIRRKMKIKGIRYGG